MARVALRLSRKRANEHDVGRVRLVLLALGVLSSACGSGEHIRVEPARENPQWVDFESEFNICPVFLGSAVNPAEITPEQPTQILVLVDDPDGLDSDLEFEWNAESGTFSEPTRALTEYSCSEPGARQLQLVARDSDGCESSLSVSVNCLED
jgi:hypothetical protein